MLDQICMCLGGHAAEKVGLGEIYTGSSSDLKRATELCRRMVKMCIRDRDKPTNGEFIAMIADKLSMEQRSA